MSKIVIGSGQYSKKTYAKAARDGAAIKTSRGKAGRARRMHRESLLKWADSKAVDEKEQTVTDPRKLVPYRGKNYGVIVQALMSRLQSDQVKSIVGKFTKDYGRILSWSGKPNKEIEAVAATPWISSLQLFEIANKLNPQLKKLLQQRQSTRKGVDPKRRVRDPLAKFQKNVEVLQRTGGVTPYALPLMEACFAIDHRWQTKNGKPEIQYRLVVGRRNPQKSTKPRVKKAKAETE